MTTTTATVPPPALLPLSADNWKLAIVVGSTRRDSINRKLAGALAKLGADAFEPSFVRIDDLPLFSFTGSRGSKLGDLGPYGKQAILFYTQTKTVTERWFDDAAVNTGVNTTISLR